MRDTIRSKEYFDTFILEEEEDGIKMFEESIANREIEEDRIDCIKDEILLIKEKIMESEEYDYLIDFVLVGTETTLDKANVSFPQPYKKLLRSIECNDKEYLKKYLRGWYKGCRESSWYGTHLIEEDNLYFGYLCFEAGAVAKRLGFNDEDLKDEQYYPYDMIHFQ